MLNHSPKILVILTEVFCISDPNVVILAWTCGVLSCGHVSKLSKFGLLKVKFDLEGQSHIVGPASYQLNSFHFMLIGNDSIPEIQLFQNFTLKI